MALSTGTRSESHDQNTYRVEIKLKKFNYYREMGFINEGPNMIKIPAVVFQIKRATTEKRKRTPVTFKIPEIMYERDLNKTHFLTCIPPLFDLVVIWPLSVFFVASPWKTNLIKHSHEFPSTMKVVEQEIGRGKK